jgi:hypothetical protein
MGVAGIRPVHRLELETKVIAGGFRIKRALQCQNRLIEQEIARLARVAFFLVLLRHELAERLY